VLQTSEHSKLQQNNCYHQQGLLHLLENHPKPYKLPLKAAVEHICDLLLPTLCLWIITCYTYWEPLEQAAGSNSYVLGVIESTSALAKLQLLCLVPCSTRNSMLVHLPEPFVQIRSSCWCLSSLSVVMVDLLSLLMCMILVLMMVFVIGA
jgi:hypothetical protein